jgi:DNA-binding response OmpR family regulator
MRILVAEDDETLRSGLGQALTAAHHSVIDALDGSQADTLLATETFDLLILDLGLPGMDGLDVLARLRARSEGINRGLPVLILSARGSMEQRVRGLDRGADDYLTKPFDLDEFGARVRALLRRGRADVMQLGGMAWEWETRQGKVGDQLLALSHQETILAETLLRRAGRIVAKAVLAQAIGHEGAGMDNKVEVYVHRLRKKLQIAGVEIQTVRGLGYQIRAHDLHDAWSSASCCSVSSARTPLSPSVRDSPIRPTTVRCSTTSGCSPTSSTGTGAPRSR